MAHRCSASPPCPVREVRIGPENDDDEQAGDGGFSVAIPEDLLDEAVKAVDKRVSESKGAGAAPPEPSEAAGEGEKVGEEVSVDVDASLAEVPGPDEMTMEELMASGLVPDRVVLAFEEIRSRAEEFEAQAKEAKERYAASMADAENFRRRVTREKNDSVKFANESVLKEILPVVDNLERALAHADAAGAGTGTVKDGVEITLRQFQHILQKLGVKKVKADAGSPFDPHLHEGVAQHDRADLPSNSIAVCMQPGYTLHERLLRPAMVAVTKASTKPAAAAAPAQAPADDSDSEAEAESGTDEGSEKAAAAEEERIEKRRAAAEAAREEKKGDAAAAAPTKAEPVAPSFETDDLDSWENTVDAERTDTKTGRGV